MKIADGQPIHEFLDLARSIMLTGPDYVINSAYWGYAAAWSFATLIIGTVYFWAAEERYGRDRLTAPMKRDVPLSSSTTSTSSTRCSPPASGPPPTTRRAS